MRKAKMAAVIVMVGLLLYGCKAGGSSPFPPEQSTIYINRDGEIYTALVSSYDTSRDYYSADELKTMAEEEAAEYNAEYSTNQADGQSKAVSVADCSLEDGTARIVYQYSDGENLSRFTEQYQDTDNHAESLTVSTVAEGLVAGKITDGTWVNVKKNATASVEDVMKQSKMLLVCVKGNVSVQTEGKIVYYSGNVNIKDDYTAEVTDGSAYLVFK